MNRRQRMNELREALVDLTHAVDEFDSWHRWISGLIPDGYPSGSDVDHVSGGGIGDPTSSTALRRQRYAQLVNDAERTVGRIHGDVKQLTNLLASGPKRINITDIKRAARCSGTVDPMCTNVADGRRHKTGLCDRCWMQRYRQERSAS